MEIKEAIEGFKIDNALLSGRKGSEWQSVIDRNNLAIKALETENALDNGYTLCKVDEAVGKMENAKFNSIEKLYCAFNDGLSTSIEILKEACK